MLFKTPQNHDSNLFRLLAFKKNVTFSFLVVHELFKQKRSIEKIPSTSK